MTEWRKPDGLRCRGREQPWCQQTELGLVVICLQSSPDSLALVLKTGNGAEGLRKAFQSSIPSWPGLERPHLKVFPANTSAAACAHDSSPTRPCSLVSFHELLASSSALPHPPLHCFLQSTCFIIRSFFSRLFFNAVRQSHHCMSFSPLNCFHNAIFSESGPWLFYGQVT